jgi:hypothetical protein
MTEEVRGYGQSTACGRRGGWMVQWGHPRAAETTIEAGSVWRLRCKDVSEAQVLRNNLTGDPFIGERCHEGFGWIAVDAPWLGYATASESVSAKMRPDAENNPDPWPGCEDEAPGIVIDIARQVAQLDEKALGSCRGALHELARVARDAAEPSHCDRVKALCERMTDRQRPRRAAEGGSETQRPAQPHRGWAALEPGQKARVLLDNLWSRGAGREDTRRPALLRFALEAMLVRARRTEEQR